MQQEKDARLRIAVIGVPGTWSSESLVANIQKETGLQYLVQMKDIVLDLDSRKAFTSDCDLLDLDALIVKKLGSEYARDYEDKLEILEFIERAGVRVFSSPRNMARVLNRLACSIALREAGIPMPPTCITENLDEAVEAVHAYGKAVIKPLLTSKGRGMSLLSAGAEARSQLAYFQAAGNRVIYIQKKVELPGQDLGVVFLGGEYLGTYARVARGGSWITSSTNGGGYAGYKPPQEVLALARRAQAVFGLDFTCVDIAETPEGPLVFEVSAFGGFAGLQKASGLDAAKAYVEYVMRRVRDGD